MLMEMERLDHIGFSRLKTDAALPNLDCISDSVSQWIEM